MNSIPDFKILYYICTLFVERFERIATTEKNAKIVLLPA